MTKGIYNEEDSVNSDERLLPSSLLCIPPSLRDRIESQDRAALFAAAQLILDIGTPSDRATVCREEDVSRHPPENEAYASEDSSDWSKKLNGLPSLTLCYASPLSHCATVHDADIEIGRRSRYLLSILVGDVGETIYVPVDLRRRIVPLLYAWLVDWDFLLRSTGSWEEVAQCFLRVAMARRSRFTLRPDFTLPWQPLTLILKSLFFQPGRVMDLHVFHAMRGIAGKHLDRVCEVASQHFGPDALEGLWETFAPYFCAESEEAPLVLCIFSHLLPVHRLVDEETNTPLPLTERIVRFLLVDSALWQQNSMNWMSYSLKIVFKMSLFHIGILDWDKYAEPLFSMMLFDQRLPMGGSNETSQRHSASGFGFLRNISLFHLNPNEISMGMGFVVNMLSNRTDSPMWNQLRRFIPATSIFIRPHATDKHALQSVFSFYSNLVVAAFRRMKAQNAFLRNRMFSSRRPSVGFLRPIPDTHIWSPSTVHCFVELIAPVVLKALHHRLKDTPRVLGLLTALAPAKMQKLLLPYLDVGIRSSGESPHQCSVALQVLNKVLYPLYECRETRAEFLAFVENVLLRVLPWMNSNDSTLSSRVLGFIFTTCTVTSLRRLLGGEDAECAFAVALVERLFESANHVDLSDSSHMDLSHVMRVLCMNVCEETLHRCVDCALREAETQGTLTKACAVAFLLEPIARYAPSRVMQWAARVLIPPLRCAATTDGDVEWCAELLAGCVRGAGLSAFAQREAIMDCVQRQLGQVMRKVRLTGAATLYSALYSALSKTVCVDGRVIGRAALAHENENESDDDSEYGTVKDEERASDGDEEEEEEGEDEETMRMGFCRGRAVRLTWREPDADHMTFLVDTYRKLVDDAVETIRCIDSVTRIDHAIDRYGLRAFISSSTGPLGNSPQPGNTEATGINEGDNGDAVTPQNVLRGVVQWLHRVLLINQELRMQCEEMHGTPNIMPWWENNPRAAWALPQLRTGTTLPLSTDAIGNALREVALCRVVVAVSERHRITTAALQQRFGSAPLCDILQCKCVESTTAPSESHLLLFSAASSHSGRAEESDLQSLSTLLSILAEQCNVNVKGAPRLLNDAERFRVMDRFSSVPLETQNGKYYLPVLSWRIKAESFLLVRRSRALHVVPPRRLSQLLALCYALLYSPHHAVRCLCSDVLQSCIHMLGPGDVRQFLSMHLDVLEHIAEIWNSSEHGRESGGDGENGASSAVLRARRSTEDERAYSSRLKRELASAFALALHGFWSPHFYYDVRLIQRTYALIVQFPEELTFKRVGGDCSVQGTASLCGLPAIEYTRAAWLTDELLTLASRFASAAPGRALGCLMMIVAVYRPSHAALLSRQSVQLLFRLTVNGNVKVRETSFHILQCLLLSLKKSRLKAHVLTRRGTVEAEGNVDFFRHRYETMHRQCASFYGIREVGLSFAPRYIAVDMEDVKSGMFKDGEVDTIPCDVAFYRKLYIGKNSTPDFNRYCEEIVSLVKQLSGIGEEKVTSVNPLINHCMNCERYEKMCANDSIPCTNIRNSNEGSNTGIRSSECDKCNNDKYNNADNSCSSNSVSAETSLRGGWVWAVMQERYDQRAFSPCRMRLWKALGKLAGVKAAVHYFTSVARLRLRDYMDLTRSNAAAAKESPNWLFACLADILIATIRMSKRDAEARCEALRLYTETLLFVCTSNLVPNEACSVFVSGINSLQCALRPGEVSSLYHALFTTLNPFTELRGKTTEKYSGTDGNYNTYNTNSNNETSGSNSEGHVDADDGAISDDEEDECRTAHAVSLSGAAKTQEVSRVLSAIFHLLCSFSREVNVLLLPQLSQLVLSNKKVFLHSSSTIIRRFAATILRQIMCLSLQQSPYAPAHATVLSGISAFFDAVERAVDRLPLPPPAPRSALAPWCATPALGAAASPTPPVSDSPAPPGGAGPAPPLPPALRLESADPADAAAGLAAVKTLAMCWYAPPPALLEARIRSVVALLARALDVALPEIDDLYETVRKTLNSIALVRLPKQTVHSTIEMLCDILGEAMPYGTSRHAKIVLCEMLRLMLFTNLHRVGKFVIMQSVAETTLQSIGHGDGRLRCEGKLLLAVLTRVASPEQTQALVQSFFRELRGLNGGSAAGLSPSCSPSLVPAAETVHRRRRIALLIALCSIAAASPGTVPVYGPRLLERLVPYANDFAPEVRRTVRQTFGEWWRSHRDGWDLEHKPYFTKPQIEVMSPLLTASTYLV